MEKKKPRTITMTAQYKRNDANWELIYAFISLQTKNNLQSLLFSKKFVMVIKYF